MPAPEEPAVVYGWRDIPPPNDPWLDMRRAPRNALGGVDFVCTTRAVDKATGRWVCGSYRIILERDTRVIEPVDPTATQAELTP
jgi:hypothetical protein